MRDFLPSALRGCGWFCRLLWIFLCGIFLTLSCMFAEELLFPRTHTNLWHLDDRVWYRLGGWPVLHCLCFLWAFSCSSLLGLWMLLGRGCFGWGLISGVALSGAITILQLCVFICMYVCIACYNVCFCLWTSTLLYARIVYCHKYGQMQLQISSSPGLIS